MSDVPADDETGEENRNQWQRDDNKVQKRAANGPGAATRVRNREHRRQAIPNRNVQAETREWKTRMQRERLGYLCCAKAYLSGGVRCA